MCVFVTQSSSYILFVQICQLPFQRSSISDESNLWTSPVPYVFNKSLGKCSFYFITDYFYLSGEQLWGLLFKLLLHICIRENTVTQESYKGKGKQQYKLSKITRKWTHPFNSTSFQIFKSHTSEWCLRDTAFAGSWTQQFLCFCNTFFIHNGRLECQRSHAESLWSVPAKIMHRFQTKALWGLLPSCPKTRRVCICFNS